MGKLGPTDHFNGSPLDADKLAANLADHLDGRDILWLGEDWWVDSDGGASGEIELTFAPYEPPYTQRVRARVKIEILES